MNCTRFEAVFRRAVIRDAEIPLLSEVFGFHMLSGVMHGSGAVVSWGIEAAVAAKIGFATHQNAIPVIRDLGVCAPADGAATDRTLTLAADPPFVQAKTWRIDAMAAADTLRIADRHVALNATLLHDLTESLVGSLTLTLTDAATLQGFVRETGTMIFTDDHEGYSGLSTSSGHRSVKHSSGNM